MAEIKSADAGRFAANPDLKYSTFLFYGPDAGLVTERADLVCAKFGVDPSDPFSLIRMDADVAASGAGRLAEEAQTVGMFGGMRLIRVSGATRRNLADAVKPVLEHAPRDSRIVIEAGELKKDAALRRLIEKSKTGIAVPCYPDNAAALDRLISGELEAIGLSIDREARDVLRSLLGGDRRATRNEIAKLAIYCDGAGRVTLEDIRALTGDVSQIDMDDIVDAATVGDLKSLQRMLDKFGQAGLPWDMLVIGTLRHFQQLQMARHQMDSAGKDAPTLAAGMRPPLAFFRRDKFARALTIWKSKEISRALTRLDDAAREARANSGLAGSMAGTALFAIALEAGRTARR